WRGGAHLSDDILRAAEVEAGGIRLNLGQNIARRAQWSSEQFCVRDEKLVTFFLTGKCKGDNRACLCFFNLGVDEAGHSNCWSERRAKVVGKLLLRKDKRRKGEGDARKNDKGVET